MVWSTSRWHVENIKNVVYLWKRCASTHKIWPHFLPSQFSKRNLIYLGSLSYLIPCYIISQIYITNNILIIFVLILHSFSTRSILFFFYSNSLTIEKIYNKNYNCFVVWQELVKKGGVVCVGPGGWNLVTMCSKILNLKMGAWTICVFCNWERILKLLSSCVLWKLMPWQSM